MKITVEVDDLKWSIEEGGSKGYILKAEDTYEGTKADKEITLNEGAAFLFASFDESFEDEDPFQVAARVQKNFPVQILP